MNMSNFFHKAFSFDILQISLLCYVAPFVVRNKIITGVYNACFDITFAQNLMHGLHPIP